MKYVSVCSGIEAATNAWHKFGWTPVAFSEIEPFPSAVLKHRFPNIPNYGDLTKYKEWPIEPGSIDLLVGGTPCQSFSVAGLRKGLADPRGNLCLTFLGLADHLRPRWILWENVVGVLSSGGGRDFGAFLGALGQLGYGWAYRVLNAEHFGVPQRRRRVFCLAYRDPVTGLGDWRVAAEALSIGEGLQRYLEKGKPSRKKSAPHVAGGAGEGGGDGTGQPGGTGVGAGCWWDGGQVSQTLDAVLAKRQTMPDKNRFPAVLQPANTSPMMFKIRGGSPTETGEQGGTPGKVAGKGFLGSEDKAFTVATSQDQWLAQPIVAPTVTTCKGSRGGSSSEAIDEITAIHLAQQQAAAIPIQDGREIEKKQNGLGVGQPGDPAYTLDTTGGQSVGQPHIVKLSELRIRGTITEMSVCPTLTAGAKQGDSEPLAVHPKGHWDGGNVHPTLNQSAKSNGLPGYSNQEIFSQGGGGLVPAVPFRKSKRAQSDKDDETWVDAEVSNTLNNFDLGDTRTTHAIVEPGQVIPTLTSKMQGQSGWAPYNETAHILPVLKCAVVNPAVAQQAFMIREDSKNDTFHAKPVETSLCVNALQPSPQSQHAQNFVVSCSSVSPAVAFQPGNLVRRGGADPSTEAFPTLTKDSGDQSPHVAVEMVVRRLSVNECLRLQGFPDNWTNIPWKGKPEGQAPDGPQYKCAGNSMAVPCMAWIGEGINRVEAKLKAKV